MAFPSISSFIRWARRVFVRTYVRWYGYLGYACRVEEKKKYLLDGPRIEFLRRPVFALRRRGGV